MPRPTLDRMSWPQTDTLAMSSKQEFHSESTQDFLSEVKLALEKHKREFRILIQRHEVFLLDIFERAQNGKVDANLSQPLSQLSIDAHANVAELECQEVPSGKSQAKDSNVEEQSEVIDTTRLKDNELVCTSTTSDIARRSSVFQRSDTQQLAIEVLVLNASVKFGTQLKSWLLGPLDVFMNVVVCLNVLVMVCQTQCSGQENAASLGFARDYDCSGAHTVFETAEYLFFCCYLFEVLLRICALRSEWVVDPRHGLQIMNIVDVAIVVTNAAELFLLPLMQQKAQSQDGVKNVKLLKLLRVTRVLRIVRAFTMFRQLRILLLTCIASFGAFWWSLLLLLLFQVAFAITLSQMLHPYIIDSSNDMDGRLWVNERYGDFFNAMYSTFEITYSGSWPSLVRPLMESAGFWYAPLILFYVTFVVFSVIRIITALFIRETMDCADQELEFALEAKKVKADKYREKVRALFYSMDANGDGKLTIAEMEHALRSDTFCRFMDLLEVKVSDVVQLFEILRSEDGRVTIDEFCRGIARIKGSARSYDLYELFHEQANQQAQLERCFKVVNIKLDKLLLSEPLKDDFQSFARYGDEDSVFQTNHQTTSDHIMVNTDHDTEILWSSTTQ